MSVKSFKLVKATNYKGEKNDLLKYYEIKYKYFLLKVLI